MPLTKMRITLNRTVQDHDPMYYTWDLDGPTLTPEDLEILATGVSELVATSPNFVNLQQASTAVFAEAFGPDGGPAYAVSTIDPAIPFGTGTASPPQTCLVVSRLVDTVRGERPLGRQYIAIGSSAAQRPSASQQNAAGNYALGCHAAFVALGWTPVVISLREGGAPRPAPVGLPITSYAVDNAWDTQRRRGAESTGRIVFDPTP